MSDETPGVVPDQHVASEDRAPADEQRPPRRRPVRTNRSAGRSAARSPRRPGPGPKRRSRGCLAALLFVIAVFAAVSAAVYFTLFAPVIDAVPGQSVQIEIPKGASTSEIGELLADAGVIANPLMFRVSLRLSGETAPLKAGVYDLATGMDYEPAASALRAGPPIEYFTLAIPEGWTIPQIAKRVQEKSGIPAAEFEQLASSGAGQFDYPFLADNKTGSLQGYLFPKTYRIKEGSTARDIADVMLKQFEKETATLNMGFAAERGLDMHAVVTIASIIEREARVAKDRPLIASVIYNRLGKGMLLEICATVQYVVGNKPRLLYSDLRVESPYNTYLHKGLPPGPIASPGLASLEAATAPATTEYLYYVLTHKDGSHSFSTTLKQHLTYKAQADRGLQ
jgi:UPF0755 protein